jgi:hypothetical protein
MNKQTNLQKSVEFKNAKDVFNYMKTKNLINQSFEILNRGMKIAYSFENHLLILSSNGFESGQALLEDSIDNFYWKLINGKSGKFILKPTCYYEQEEIIDSARDPDTGIVDKNKFQ